MGGKVVSEAENAGSNHPRPRTHHHVCMNMDHPPPRASQTWRRSTPRPQIGEGVTISPFSTIAADVVIGPGTWIGPNVTLMDGTRIGANCRIFPGAVIGGNSPRPQVRRGEHHCRNWRPHHHSGMLHHQPRHHRTDVHPGWIPLSFDGVLPTLPHDAVVGDHLCAGQLRQHCRDMLPIEDWVIIEGVVAVQQFVRIGEHAFVAGGSLVRKKRSAFCQGRPGNP